VSAAARRGTARSTAAATARRRAARAIALDRALEALPLFRLSDSADDSAIVLTRDDGTRWRVIPHPGDRLPGTFDQDVYVELVRRYHDAGRPADGVVVFTLHNFLRSLGRRVDGRTYEQLRSALTRLQRTVLESTGAWVDAATGTPLHGSFSLLSAIKIDRRRAADVDQLGLFPALPANEPGDARVTLATQIRSNIAAGFTSHIVPAQFLGLSSPVARRLYRLVAVAAAEGVRTWSLPLIALAEQLPLAQRYPSHLQRVLQPANEMLVAAGLVRSAALDPDGRQWTAVYELPETPA
jgi:plasmid replication initiation protein